MLAAYVQLLLRRLQRELLLLQLQVLPLAVAVAEMGEHLEERREQSLSSQVGLGCSYLRVFFWVTSLQLNEKGERGGGGCGA